MRAACRNRALAALGLLGLVAAAAPDARAQYLFGQNKVMYGSHTWKVLATPRLDVYYYAGEEELAAYAAAFAEKTCVEYETYFRHTFQQKIPFILYASHHEFTQTNVIDAMISDFVGGFTESIRGRVAIPHTGSTTQLRNVIRHELVHAFMNDKLEHLLSARRRYSLAGPPLWFSEGLAEYVALKTPDSEARMFLRDLVVNGNLVEMHNLWRISGSFLMYKEGESICGFIADRFGDPALVQILENWWMSDDFNIVLERTVGLSVEELNRDWVRALRRRYYPAVLTGEWADEHGHPVTQGRGLSTRPAPIPSTWQGGSPGDLVFLSGRSGNIDILRAHADSSAIRIDDRSGYRFETLVRSGRDGRCESIPPFASGLAVLGERLAFTAKSGARDALVVWDLERRQELARFTTENLTVLASPAWAPDGSAIVFAGLDRRGWPDLYRIAVPSGEVRRLTDDPADDRDPGFSPDGRHIAWSSDRDAHERDRAYHLWMLDTGTGAATRITSGDAEDAAPDFSPDGTSLLYTSDADGQTNVYLLELATGERFQVTHSLGGIFTPRWLPDGTGFVASAFANTAFNVLRFPVDRRHPVAAEPTPKPAAPDSAAPSVTAGVPEEWRRAARDNRFEARAYRARFGLDFVRTAVAFDPDFQSATGGQLGFTDMLGNHQLYLHASTSAYDVHEFWRHLNAGITYTNLTRRLNYTLGGFHLISTYDPRLDLYRYERRYGVLAAVAYPLSRFRRLESSVVARISERDFAVYSNTLLVSLYASYIHDNTLWSYAGAAEGTRFNLTLGQTLDASGTGRGGSSVNADLRRYVPLPLRSVFAGRAVARSNWGDDLGFFYLGGPFDLRGYPRRSLFGKRMLMLNGELRFPLVDRLLIGLPFNDIELGGFRGAFFSDAAYIGWPFERWAGNLGGSAELALGGGFVARLDIGRLHDFHHFVPGYFTRFFLGWDF